MEKMQPTSQPAQQDQMKKFIYWEFNRRDCADYAEK